MRSPALPNIADASRSSQLKQAQAKIDELNRQLLAQVDDLTALLELAPIGIVFSDDPECRSLELNEYGCSLTGLPEFTTTPVNADPSYVIEQDGRPIAPEDLPLQQVWKTGKALHDFRGQFVGPGDHRFELLMSASPVHDVEGEIRRVIGVINDITPLVAAREDAESRARHHAYVAQLGKQSIADISAEQMIAELPDRLAELLSVDFAKVLLCLPGQDELELASSHGFDVPPGTRVGTGAQSQARYTLTMREPVTVEDLSTETRFNGPPLLRDAGVVSGLSVIIGDPDEPLGVLGVHTATARAFSDDDRSFLQSVSNVLAATLRRTAADRQKQLLLDELRHRVKNMLATVQSVTSLTLRGAGLDPEVKERLTNRIQTLALAHDLNFRRNDDVVDLAELVRIQIEPYDPNEERVTVRGRSACRLPPDVAIDMSMIVHELVTNAIKHGALAGDEGEVTITLDDGSQQQNRVRFEWRERHPRAQDPQTRAGSGTMLLKAIGAQPHFDVDWTMAENGLVCSVTVNL
ncbi:sensor histidine kinase [Sulfitobacter aestuarii]|uniref:histidine kinase n=1 Tax=Sulfitobacter aestuarii TaxID=2161676 RepID=A0ABW5U6F5_9RHOB